MILIRSHRFTGPVALFLAVALVIAIAPGMATTVQAADGGTAVLLLPAADESGSEFSDLGEMTTNKLQAAVGSIEGIDVTEFHPTSPLVRRAISEGRLLSGQVEVEVGDVAGAIEIGHKLGMDAILLTTITSVDVHSSVRYLTVTLKGEYFEVKSNYDEAVGQPSSALWPEKSFTETGTSHPRANYTGSDRPLLREALDDAVTKFAEVMAGTPAGELAAKPRESEKTSKWKWLGPLLVLGLVAFIVGSSGGGDDGLTRGQPVRILLATDALARLQDARPACAVDRSVHPASAHQAAIGRVHDRVHLLLGDVSGLHDHTTVQVRPLVDHGSPHAVPGSWPEPSTYHPPSLTTSGPTLGAEGSRRVVDTRPASRL